MVWCALGKERQAEFKASLAYRANLDSQGNKRNPVLKKDNNKKK